MEIADTGGEMPVVESPEGLGLKIMEYRCNIIGARLNIVRGPGGYRVQVRIPRIK